MDLFFKVFTEIVTILFMGFFLGGAVGLKAHGILIPQTGIEPIPPALEGKILTTRPPGKSSKIYMYFRFTILFIFGCARSLLL